MSDPNDRFLPPIHVCCDKCRDLIINVHSNNTIHFAIQCPEHGYHGVESPFSKSQKFNYTIRVSKNIKDDSQQTFLKDFSPEAEQKRKEYRENLAKKGEE